MDCLPPERCAFTHTLEVADDTTEAVHRRLQWWAWMAPKVKE